MAIMEYAGHLITLCLVQRTNERSELVENLAVAPNARVVGACLRNAAISGGN
jgi:hypothetical protein